MSYSEADRFPLFSLSLSPSPNLYQMDASLCFWQFVFLSYHVLLFSYVEQAVDYLFYVPLNFAVFFLSG